jgi:hypothetical protein
MLRGAPARALGVHLEILAETRSDPARAEAAARALARGMASFAPFVELAEGEGASVAAAVRLDSTGATFGYVEVHRDGLRQLLSSDLEMGLAEHGFARAPSDDGAMWILPGGPALPGVGGSVRQR